MSAAPSIARISQLFRDGDHAAVVDACDLALGQGGDASKLAHYKANALVSAGRIREALSFLTSIAAQQQHQRSLVPVHAYCLYKTNRLGDARALIREHKAKSADEANAVDLKLLYLEAQVAYRMGDYEEALGIYRKLLSTVKEDDATYSSLLCNYLAVETALAHSGRSTAAPAATHVTDDPADYEVTFNRACVLTANKQFSAALPLLDEALERARKTLAAEAAEGQSTVEEAEQELNAFRLQRAYILQGSGHLDEARAVYREILDKKPSDILVATIAANNWASTHRERPGDAEDAAVCEAKKLGLVNYIKRRGLRAKSLPYQMELLNSSLAVMSAKKTSSKETRVLWDASRAFHTSADKSQALQAFRDAHATFASESTLFALVQALLLSGSLQEAADLIKPRVIGVKRPAMGLASLYLWIVGALNSSRVVSTLAEITTTAEVAKRVRPETLAPLTCAYPQPNTSLQLLRAFTLLDIGDTKQALDIFTSVMREDPSDKLTLAGLVITTASSDPSQANVYAEHLATSGITRSYAVPTDIEQLGSLHVAHNAKQRTARVKISAKTAASAKKHRNKRRGKLPKNADPNIKPDPERWIPKHMRAGAKRHRKRKGKHAEVAKGPQGSAETAVDALDIAAKSAPQHPSGGASSKPKKKKGGKNKW